MRINVEEISLTKKNKNTKLCILSDIHHISKCHTLYYNTILKKVSAGKPTFILIPGDIIDHPNIIQTKYINYLIDFLKELSLIAPVIISKGNHELKPSKNNIQEFYNKLKKFKNIYVLDNASITLKNYQFLGFSPSNRSYLNKYKKFWHQNFITEFNNCHFITNNNKIKILLCHSPSVITSLDVQKNIPAIKNMNYIICGHMHNGLLPKIFDNYFKDKGLFGPEHTLFPRYCRGIHQFNNNQGKLIICKSLRVLSKDNLIFRTLNHLYAHNITFIKID